MKKYIETKEVNAISMNRQEYNNFKGWKLPDDEDGTDEGYLVEYIDGCKANTAQYNGYVSWLPKGVFERSYALIETPLERMYVEYDELLKKYNTLGFFLQIKDAKSIVGDVQFELMQKQETIMHDYIKVLKTRIREHFEPKSK